MNAMIFAAGIGSRLKPFTDYQPKALVPVGGKVSLARVIDNLNGLGVKKIVVNVHHFADHVIQFLKDYPNVVISDERAELLDTGGGLLRAKSLFGDESPILLHNADLFTEAPMVELMDNFNHTLPYATLLVQKRATNRKLCMDASGRLCGWMNHTTGDSIGVVNGSGIEEVAYAGISCVSFSIFRLLEEYESLYGPKFSLTPFFLWAAQRATIQCYLPSHSFCWFDLGTPQKLAAAEAYIENKKCNSL